MAANSNEVSGVCANKGRAVRKGRRQRNGGRQDIGLVDEYWLRMTDASLRDRFSPRDLTERLFDGGGCWKGALH